MLGLQTHHEGSGAGLQVLGSRCYTYSLPGTRVPCIDSNHTKFSHGVTRGRLIAWANGNNTVTNKAILPRSRALSRPDAMPFVTSVAMPHDLPRLVEIEFAAFREEKVNHQLSYRDGANPDHAARAIKFYRDCMDHLRTIESDRRLLNGHKRERSDSKVELVVSSSTFSLGYRFRKVSDPKTGEIIAFAKTEMTVLTLEDMRSPLDIGHEGESDMNRAWFALNEKLHRDYNGLRRHCYFGMLATHPDHQHRGAATMLMDELVAEADALGLEMYCEATKTGRPLYEKYGFVTVKTLVFDPALYGVENLGVETQSVMVRGALGKDGARRAVRSWEEAAVEAKSEVDAALRKECRD